MTAMCSHLDEFVDGELASAQADAFRAHLATCDRCQRQLEGRMQEMLVAAEAAPVAAEVIPIARGRTKYLALGGGVLAAAAAVMIVFSHSHHAKPIEPFAMTVSVEHHSPTFRDGSKMSAHVGDVIHLETVDTVWVYRDDHELVLACPGGSGCRAGGADFTVKTTGHYAIVLLEGPSIPTPVGDYDTDVSKAVQAGVATKPTALVVE
ncbi:MAG: zf-HC2 domain-containing protein [Kofleriaceae bacterium]